jgi:hypothetical protein
MEQFYYTKGLPYFHSTCKILVAVYLKHSSFWPPVDVKLNVYREMGYYSWGLYYKTFYGRNIRILVIR